jgi:hypothetical protein
VRAAVAERTREELDARIDNHNNAVAHRKSRISKEPTQPVWSEESRQKLRAPATSYQPHFAQEAIEWMAKGYSLGAVAGRIGVARSTVFDWMERFPEFGRSVARARAAQQHYWETRFIDAVENSDGAPGNMIMFALKNVGREDWKDKQEIEISGQLTFSNIIENAMKTIEARRNPPAELQEITTTYQEVAETFDDLF